MKEKLTLEHLAPYLPYGLKILFNNSVSTVDSVHIKLTIEGNRGITTWRKHGRYTREINLTLSEIKLLLHPLSKLTREIEHNEEKFIPLNKLSNHAYEIVMNNNFVLEDIERLLYRDVIKLFEWHFDVFDLHSKNLCIYYDELKK